MTCRILFICFWLTCFVTLAGVWKRGKTRNILNYTLAVSAECCIQATVLRAGREILNGFLDTLLGIIRN